MQLTKINVKKFKKVSSATIVLANLNILVGANGSGKSSMLQAIHLASCLMRQARELRMDKTSTVSVGELDYLPSDHYSELGHNAVWGNVTGTPSSEVSFTFDNGSSSILAECKIRAARNAGLSVSGTAPGEVNSLFRGAGKFFSAYIPGISGIPNQEQKQSRRVVLKACSFGDSNVYLRNALKLLNEVEITKIQNWLKPLMGEVKPVISHNENLDLTIQARAALGTRTFPLELLGAGYLQLIQIFCYVLLFNPKILLIDEPDIHLHPNVQEKLASVLSKISEEQDVKMLLSTHSPFVVRGAPISTNIYWMDNGAIKNSSREAIEIGLGWGAFGKKIILISEDQKFELLKKIVAQWPELENLVTFRPGSGYKSLIKKDEALELYKTLGEKYHILVHRDRDSLTDGEAALLKSNFHSEGISLWITDLSDIEAYFCNANIISQVLSCDETLGEDYISQVLQTNAIPIKDQFIGQRGSHNQEIYQAAGGSPSTDEVWEDFQSRPLKGAKGKTVFKALKNLVPHNKFSEASVQALNLDGNLALSLKQELEQILNS